MTEQYFADIDHELINLIYFKEEKDKADYLQLVYNKLKILKIDNTTQRIDTLNRIADNNDEIPFILDILLFSNDYSFSKKTQRNNYYTICKLCKFNLTNKIKDKIQDFEPEEFLLTQALSSDLHNYARIETLFKFGEAYAAIEQPTKRDYYFDLIRKGAYDLSPSSVTRFYQLIAELYISIGDNDTALSWLKGGVLINSKFPVKRKIKELEKLTGIG